MISLLNEVIISCDMVSLNEGVTSTVVVTLFITDGVSSSDGVSLIEEVIISCDMISLLTEPDSKQQIGIDNVSKSSKQK